MLRLLGLDIGTARIGVALSDPLGITAQPLEVIEIKRMDPYNRILEIIEEYQVEKIIVGDPLTLDGKNGLAVETVDVFIEQLKNKTKIPIEKWDERMTTAVAQRMLITGGVRRKKRKKVVDKVAAALILQSYLDAMGIK